MPDSTTRFSDRVTNYKKYRPTYPCEAIEYLFGNFGLNGQSVIADIGSGTGKLSALLLPHCRRVLAVEPNTPMRREAEAALKADPGFVSVDGTAEQSGLADHTVDAITVAQAFHWFDLAAAKAEFSRILKTDGPVFLIWNKRCVTTPFQKAYESFLSSGIIGYAQGSHHNITPEIIHDFMPTDFTVECFTHRQILDWEGLLGRFHSSSYTPAEGTEAYFHMQQQLKQLFQTHSEKGRIAFDYHTEVYSGRI